MALQHMILVPTLLLKNSSLTPPPVKQILKSKDHSYNKWTQGRLHHDPYLKSDKQMREPILIPIIENSNAKPKQNGNAQSVQCLCLKQNPNGKPLFQSIFKSY